MKGIRALPLLFLAVAPAVAQKPVAAAGASVVGEQSPAIKLSSTEEAKQVVRLLPSSGMSRPVLGGDGIYLQLFDRMATEDSDNAIQTIDLRGHSRTVVDLNALMAAGTIASHAYFIEDYAQDARSGIDVLLGWDDHTWHSGILHMGSRADFGGLTVLQDIGFRPTRLASFFSGGFLIAGVPTDDRNGVAIAIVDTLGKIAVPGSAFAMDAPPTGTGASNKSKDDAMDAPPAGFTISLASCDDGFVYVYNPLHPKTIMRISEAGKQVPIPVQLPPLGPGEKFWPKGIHAIHGQLMLHAGVVPASQKAIGEAIQYKRFYLSVYDPWNGDLLTNYEVDDSFGLTLFGYEPRNFYFLKFVAEPSGGYSGTVIHATP